MTNIQTSLALRRFAHIMAGSVVAGSVSFATAFADDLPIPRARRSIARAGATITDIAVEPIVITGAYALPALKGGTGGAFMTITNSGTNPVRIARASSVDADAVELHESMQHNGTTHMQMLPTLDIAPGASAALKSGGRHFMLVGLRKAFAVRDTMHLVLHVENVNAKSTVRSSARDIATAVPVRLP